MNKRAPSVRSALAGLLSAGLLFCTAFVVDVHGQDKTPASGFEIEASGAGSALIGPTFGEDIGPGGTAVLRWSLPSGFGIGLGGSYLAPDPDRAGASTIDMWQGFGEARWRLGSGSAFSPFVAGRVGYVRLERGSRDTDGLSASLVGGFELWASDHFAFRTAPVATFFDVDDEATLSDGVSYGLEAGFVISTGGRGSADGDGDGVSDGMDRCPGTRVGVEVDAEGCPRDGDADGVADYADRCPGTAAGVRVNAEGCATDGDGDGVPDGVDRCPNTAQGAQVDSRGCATDGDGDGVPDGIDQCAGTPAGAEVDAEGCATDGDGDGVADGIDRCPGTPADTEVDEQGCSRIEAQLEEGRLTLRNIHFAFGSAEIQADSREVLDEVGQALIQRPGLEVQIQGHTDSIGSDRVNREMSWMRARSVKQYLVRNFSNIRPARLVPVGMGETRPIADNGTDSGRAQNRRVEFVVVSEEGS